MIPYGVEPADDWKAAEVFNVTVGTWRNTKRWEHIPGLKQLGGTGQRPRRVFAVNQLVAAADWWTSSPADRPPQPDLPELPAEEHDLDLLTLEEARLSLPEDHRPARGTWAWYKRMGQARFPEPDFIYADEEYWYRHTIRAWDRARPGRGKAGGRTAGSKDAKPRRRTAPRMQQADQRRAKIRELRAANSSMRARDLAGQLGVSERTIDRDLSMLANEDARSPSTGECH